jgi:GAF domain-containing protein
VLAAFFTPLRNRLQQIVDRYFGRAPEPRKKLRAFTDQLRSIVRAFDREQTARQFLDHAVGALQLSGAALYVSQNGVATPLSESGNVNNGYLRIPMVANGEEVGFLLLGQPAGGTSLGEDDLEMLQSTANLVADAFTLAQRTSAPTRLD